MVSIGKEGSAFVSDYRTSSSAQIDRYETHLVQCLLRRFAHFQGIDDVQRIEPFQVVEYVDQQQVCLVGESKKSKTKCNS